MNIRFISCSTETALAAVASLMKCVPQPWTETMVDDAVTVVLDVADQWRSNESHEVDVDDLLASFLESCTRTDQRMLVSTVNVEEE